MGEVFHLNEKGFWRFINAVILSSIGLFGAGKFLGVAEVRAIHVVAAWLAVTWLFILNYAAARGRILCMAAGIIISLGAGAALGIHNYTLFIRSYVSWLLGRFSWREEWVTGYEIFQVVFLAVVCYLVQILMEKYFQVKAAVLFLVFSGLLFCLFTERELSHVEVSFILCYIAIIFVEWTQAGWEKEKGRGIHAYMLWLTPFLALYFLLMMLMPVPDGPYKWQFVRNIYEQFRESFLEISQNIARGGQEDYDLSLSGFTESGELEGVLGRDDREIMTLESGTPLMTNVYLTGKVYDTFDGRQWLQLNEDTSKERYMDTAETLYALRRYEKNYEQDYLSRVRLKVNYRYFHTRFLFAPLKTWMLEQEGAKMSFTESGGTLLLDGAKGYGTEYEAVFYQMNEGQAAFNQFLEEKQEPDEEILEELLQDVHAITDENIRAEDLESHRQKVYNNYLKEITLSEEVRDLLASVTEREETNLDKLRALEAALASLRYTRTPGELPETVTDESGFLDYFLLESRQGYCNYFATAFVLLARAQGLPARYVQGFCVPMEGRMEATVYSYMAHAWPEVYLEDIGWIPFEPTPGYAESRYGAWELKGKRDGAAEKEVIPVKWQLGEEGADGKLREGEDWENNDTGEENSGIGRLFRIAGVVFISVFVIGILVLLLDILINRYRYRKMNDAEKLNVDIRKIMRILAVMGIRREAGETLEEFAKRTEDVTDRKEIMCFMETYEGLLYGNRQITADNIREVRKKESELMEILWERNKFDFFRAKIYNSY